MSSENSKPKEKKWHYLDVNKGRYLCLKHGGFCDVADGYARKCPLCNKNDDKHWQINHVDTALQIVRNLQARSVKRFFIIYGVTGFLGLLSFFKASDPYKIIEAIGYTSVFILFCSSICFFASFICFLTSMAHVKVTYRGKICGIFGTAKFSKKTIKEWEGYMACHLHIFELFHAIGNKSLVLSVGFFIAFLIIQLF